MFQIAELLLVFQSLQSSDGRLDCDSRSGAVGSGSTSRHFLEGTTVPDPHSSSFCPGFATEGANVLDVLADFSFLHHFPEGGAIMGPVFMDDSDLCAFSLYLASPFHSRETRAQGKSGSLRAP